MYTKFVNFFALLILVAGLAGCGSNNALTGTPAPTPTPTPTDPVPVTPTVSRLIIGTDKVAVMSDGLDSATITVTALDANNGVVSGSNIVFAAPSGQLTNTMVTTGTDGKATVLFSAGSADPTNQTVTITASAGAALTASVPVQIVGSTVQFTSTAVSQLTIGGVDTATLTLTAADSGGNPVFNVPVTVIIDTTSTATGQLDPAGAAAQTYTANTDVSGKISVAIRGLTPGNLLVRASALGATATKTLMVQNNGGALEITSPVDSTALKINTSHAVTITVPAGMTNVTLATSLGQWDTVNTAAVNSGSYEAVNVGGTTINATISSLETGTATVMVFDSANVSVSHTIKLYFVNTTVDANSKITLQAATGSVPVSVGNTVYNVQITGYVTDAADNPIANAPVSLSMNNQPGGGEYLDPPYVFSDSAGVFQTTFYSGSLGSDSNGVDVIATLMGNGKTASVKIIISQIAGSVVIGASTVVSSINNNTAYKLPMSVQVADANGSPLPNATVSLRIWPKRYYRGFWNDQGEVVYTAVFPNEDVNRNLVRDPGEDLNFVEGHYTFFDGLNYYNADLNGDGDGYDVVGSDGLLTPPNTSSGTIPSSVTTDANGVGTFDLVYLKAYAAWITAEVTATVQVQGSESTGVLTFILPVLKGDATGHTLANSPFNQTSDASYSPGTIGMGSDGVGAMSSLDNVAVNGQSILSVMVTAGNNTPVVGANVSLAFVSKGSGSPTLSNATIVTGANGTGTANYTAGAFGGTDVILVQTTISGIVYSNYIIINVR